MNKKLIVVLVVMTMLCTGVPAAAADMNALSNSAKFASELSLGAKSFIFNKTITVTSKGGIYNVGFLLLHFPKDFLEKDRMPVTFDVNIYAENGVPYLEVNPDTKNFKKPVSVIVLPYYGFLYDVEKEENIFVKIKAKMMKLKSFSRYSLY